MCRPICLLVCVLCLGCSQLSSLDPKSVPAPASPAYPKSVRTTAGLLVSIVEAEIGPIVLLKGRAAIGRHGVPVARDWVEVRVADQGLRLRVRIENQGSSPFSYRSLSKEDTQLADEKGNRFRAGVEEQGYIKGQLERERIDPGKSVQDLFVFSADQLGKGQHLLLELRAKPLGGDQGVLKLGFDQSAIVR